MTAKDERAADRFSDARVGAPDGNDGIPRYRAAELIGGASWAVIEHGGAEYRLRITRLGKLILNK